jgi:hypothetical protein
MEARQLARDDHARGGTSINPITLFLVIASALVGLALAEERRLNIFDWQMSGDTHNGSSR